MKRVRPSAAAIPTARPIATIAIDLLDDETQDVARLRAQGHADAEFARAPRDFVGEQTVEADARERQREDAEESRYTRHQTFLKQHTIHLFGLRHHFEQREDYDRQPLTISRTAGINEAGFVAVRNSK